jgi:hypothetical protein
VRLSGRTNHEANHARSIEARHSIWADVCTARVSSLILMYCRDTTDAATEQITGRRHLSYYFNRYTAITDRTPEPLSSKRS